MLKSRVVCYVSASLGGSCLYGVEVCKRWPNDVKLERDLFIRADEIGNTHHVSFLYA